MAQFLTYSEIDTEIQNRMSGQAPDSTKRLEAINDSLNDLYSLFDIESGKRDLIFYVVADGQPVALTDAPDFKKASDLRYLSSSKQNEEFAYIDDDLFATHIGSGRRIDEYAVVYNSGDLFIKVNTSDGLTSQTLHNMSSLTDNGTWSVASDATSLTTTSVTTLNQTEDIEFDVDVSASGDNYAIIENSTISSLDLSDYENLGRLKFWVFIPSTTDFTSVEARWGTDSSNYYSQSATVQADGSNLVSNNWNYIELDWNGASQTGTPDNEDIGYLAVKMNYAAGYTDANNFRVESLDMFLPTPMKLVYYTYYLSQTTGGVFQEDLTTTSTDQLLIPRRYKDLIITSSLIRLFPMALGDDAVNDVRRLQGDFKRQEKALDMDIGSSPKVPSKKMKIRPMY